jgi:hypothetical protein
MQAVIRTRGQEKFKFANLAAAQGERDGVFWLGWCFYRGEGCEKNLDKRKENFLLASKLGHVSAMRLLGHLLDQSDPQRWRWWGRTAALGFSWDFLSHFAKQVGLFNSGSGSAAAMFAIGQALQEHMNEHERTIFSSDDDFASRIGPAKQAIAFYEAQIKAAKDAMRAWTFVGIKLKVVEGCEKVDCKIDLGCKRRSVVRRVETRYGGGRRSRRSRKSRSHSHRLVRCMPKRELANEKIDFFFSQEMASSSSHNSIPLATLLEWYKIRDTFFGQNWVDRRHPFGT